MELAPAADVDAHPAGVTLPLASVVAAMAFGSVVFLAMSTAPILLGGLVQAGRMTNENLGEIATLELLGVAAGAVAGASGGLMRENMRLKALLCCMGLAALNWACVNAVDPVAMGTLRACSGLLGGLILGAANLILTCSRNPEATNGYFLGVTTIPQIAAALVLTGYAVPKYGPGVGFQVMAAASLIAAAASWLASGGHIPKESAHAPGRGRWTILGAVMILAVVLQNAAVGACFAYIVQIASQNHVPEGVAGGALAGLQFTAMVGAMLVGIVAYRFSQAIILTGGCLLQVVVSLALAHWQAPMAFVVASGIFGFFWNGLLPFALKLTIKIDPTRRLALFNTPAALAGLALGPFIASVFVSAIDVAPAFNIAAGLFATGAMLFLVINLLLERSRLRAA